MSRSPSSSDVAALRQAIRAQEESLRGTPATPSSVARSSCMSRPPCVPLGLPGVDAALPWGGLPADGMHEICTAEAGGTGGEAVATAFAAFLAGRFQQAAAARGTMGREAVIWCRLLRRRQEGGLPHGPGLRACGLVPEGLILAEAQREDDLFWALEEALRDGRAAAVLGEAGSGRTGAGRTGTGRTGAGRTGAGRGGALPDIALRRLQLAAERSGRPLLLLRPDPGAAGRGCPSLTRWRVTARPGIAVRRPEICEKGHRDGRPAGADMACGSRAGADMARVDMAGVDIAGVDMERGAGMRSGILPPPVWQLDLLRCRGARPARWLFQGTFQDALPVPGDATDFPATGRQDT